MTQVHLIFLLMGLVVGFYSGYNVAMSRFEDDDEDEDEEDETNDQQPILANTSIPLKEAGLSRFYYVARGMVYKYKYNNEASIERDITVNDFLDVASRERFRNYRNCGKIAVMRFEELFARYGKEIPERTKN